MKVLITGASSGLGLEMAKIFSSKYKCDLILVARNEEKLKEIKNELKTNVVCFKADLSKREEVNNVSQLIKKENIDVLVNNAGFGLFGEFSETDLERELEMIDLNVKAVHELTKSAVLLMKEKNSGYILNVASSAGLLPGGPLLNTYYATKSYVRSLTLGIYEELKKNKSNVKISVLCPGPFESNFNKVANTDFNISSLTSLYVADYGIKKMFKEKLVIVPGFSVKVGLFFRRILSIKMLLKITYKIQDKKRRK